MFLHKDQCVLPLKTQNTMQEIFRAIVVYLIIIDNYNIVNRYRHGNFFFR